MASLPLYKEAGSPASLFYRMRKNLQRSNAAFAAQIWRRKRIKTQAFYSFPVSQSRPKEDVTIGDGRLAGAEGAAADAKSWYHCDKSHETMVLHCNRTGRIVI